MKDMKRELTREAIGRYVVRTRRLADLSQRELAGRLGVASSTVGRFETGAAAPGVELFQHILALADLRLTVVDREGNEVVPVPVDTVRDNQGRRFPAHLDVAPPDEVPYERWAFPRYDRPAARAWFRHRATRDQLTVDAPHRERPADHPTERVLRRRRRLMRGRQPRVDAPPRPEVGCECLDDCFLELCVSSCSCQCEPERDRFGRPIRSTSAPLRHTPACDEDAAS
jgi:HTH-type transcriptional regulator/antitoxin HipB